MRKTKNSPKECSPLGESWEKMYQRLIPEKERQKDAQWLQKELAKIDARNGKRAETLKKASNKVCAKGKAGVITPDFAQVISGLNQAFAPFGYGVKLVRTSR